MESVLRLSAPVPSVCLQGQASGIARDPGGAPALSGRGGVESPRKERAPALLDEGGMKSFLVSTCVVGLLLAALTQVTWRQVRALEELAEIDRVRREASLVIAEQHDLANQIRALESRARVTRVARERLGMRAPDATEIVWLSRSGAAYPGGVR